MVTQTQYLEVRMNTRWMLRCVRAVHNRDLSNVDIFIAPASGISALTGGNPAIYIRRNQIQIAVNNWVREMTEYAEEHPHEDIPHNLIARGTCIILSENVLAWELMRRCGVLWHEYGHAYNELVGRPNTEQNAYLFEVEMIDWASTTNIFGENGIGVNQVLAYLDWRQQYFDAGITPALTALLASVRARLRTMRRHGFMHA